MGCNPRASPIKFPTVMINALFIGTAVLYLIALTLEVLQRICSKTSTETSTKNWAAVVERFSFLTFTVSICVLAYQSSNLLSTDTKYSFAWLLLTWAIAGANLLTEVLYQSRVSKPSTFTWIVFVIFVFPAPESHSLAAFFEDGITWLNFHRVVFILGYAFYLLGIPILMNFIWTNVLIPIFFKRPKGAVLEHYTRELEQVHLNLILWALPLLSLGIFTKILVWIENGMSFNAEMIWQASQGEFLAITTWFTCALFLHTRIFLRWRYSACAYVYLFGLIVVVAAHLSGQLLLQIT